MKKIIPLKMVTRLSVIFLILGLLLIIIGCFIGTMAGLIIIGLGLLVLIGNIIYISLFCRCPHCRGFTKLRLRNFYCPHCGNYVDLNANVTDID